MNKDDHRASCRERIRSHFTGMARHTEDVDAVIQSCEQVLAMQPFVVDANWGLAPEWRDPV